MRALVTGAAGFSGSHVVAALVAGGGEPSLLIPCVDPQVVRADSR